MFVSYSLTTAVVKRRNLLLNAKHYELSFHAFSEELPTGSDKTYRPSGFVT
jgi:hypothetical protein